METHFTAEMPYAEIIKLRYAGRFNVMAFEQHNGESDRRKTKKNARFGSQACEIEVLLLYETENYKRNTFDMFIGISVEFHFDGR